MIGRLLRSTHARRLAVAVVVTVAGERTARADSEPSGEAVHATPLPDNALTIHPIIPFPTVAWVALQTIPSPEIAVGRQHDIDEATGTNEKMSTAFGLRWQLTPFLWSFGVHRSQTRWRTFVVDPLARHSGSLELSLSLEYIFGHIDRFLARPTVRTYLPLIQRGESLSMSLGTSVYDYDGLRVAYEVGAYVLSGLFGVQLAVAPTHNPMAALITFRVRYF